jgi:hypothetical protein
MQCETFDLRSMSEDLSLTVVVHVIGRHVADGLAQPLVVVVIHEASDGPLSGAQIRKRCATTSIL